ncbi:MAG: hypothetical protein WCH46_03140 [bacterium]
MIKSILFSIVLFSATVALQAQPIPTSTSYALIFPRTGDGFSGHILRVDPDTVVIFTNDYKYIAKKDIGRIVLQSNPAKSKGFLVGSSIGMYLMNYWLGTATHQTGGFLWDGLYGSPYQDYSSYSSGPYGVIGIALLGVLTGGGIGYLTDLGNESGAEVVYVFAGSPSMQNDQWIALSDAIDHSSSEKKFHLAVSGGQLVSNIAKPYYDNFRSAGYTQNSSGYYSYSGSYVDYQNSQIGSNFNWLRSLELAADISKQIQIGVEYAVLSEPSIVSSKDAYSYPSTSSSLRESGFVAERYTGHGYYATFGFTNTISNNHSLQCLLKLGAGLATIDFDLTGNKRVDSNYSVNISNATENVTIAKNTFSLMGSAGISYFFYDSFSMGLDVNYFFAGSETIRALPLVGINEHKVNFGNLDVGFVLGYHF